MSLNLQYIKQSLQGYYPASEAASLAKLVLMQVFNMSILELYSGKDRCFSEKEQKQLDDILIRLQKYEPIQYIIGVEEFCGLTFEVNENVLIPRPETQELVDWIIKECNTSITHVLDIGTGSGCIPITLAKYLPEVQVTSWDISKEALSVAQRNCCRHNVKVKLEQKDVLTFLPTMDERYNLIVSNPPYITEKERVEMEANVLEWEPDLALFVPDNDPLLFYRKIAELGITLLLPLGKLFFEINRDYGNETVRMLEGLGYHHIELKKDLSGNDRMIKAIR